MLMNLRHVYWLASLLLSRSLWNSMDPLEVLNAWNARADTGLLGTKEDEEDDVLVPILGK